MIHKALCSVLRTRYVCLLEFCVFSPRQSSVEGEAKLSSEANQTGNFYEAQYGNKLYFEFDYFRQNITSCSSVFIREL